MKHGICFVIVLGFIGIAVATLESTPYGELSQILPSIAGLAAAGIGLFSLIWFAGFQIICAIIRLYAVFALWFSIRVKHTKNINYRKLLIKSNYSYYQFWKLTKVDIEKYFEPIWEG